jgi:hypothetical protein
MMHRRGMAVVWLRAPKLGFEQLCRGLQGDLGVDGLIVLVAKRPPTSLAATDRIVPFELTLDARGGMDLVRALEELTPDYRKRVLDDPMLDLDSSPRFRRARASATSSRSTARTSAASARAT